MTNENQINKWAECMSSMQDKKFFDIMRLYLGEIKTPYNKQRLIEQLASFIKNPINTQNIISLLDEFDIRLLTAISIIPRVNISTLQCFFENEYHPSTISESIQNLKERLIIYEETLDMPYEIQYLYHINPLLLEQLKPYFDFKLLLPQFTVSRFSTEDNFTISPNFLNAFISYLKVRGISCKNDGQIKKNDITRLEQVFQNKTILLQMLMNAFINLNLVREIDKKYQINQSRIESIAQIPQMQQYALLCAAAITHLSKDNLRREAQLLLDCLSSIPEGGYTREAIVHLSYLVDSLKDNTDEIKQSRFSQMIDRTRSTPGIFTERNSEFLDMMIDCAIEFGLLQKIGYTDNGEILYNCCDFDISNENSAPAQLPKVVNLDSTYTVTIMPGLTLQNLLPLTSFMVIKKTGVVTEFEITKQSVASSFDSGWTPDEIFAEIEKYSHYEIPQNLRINITEWYNAYSSAILYHGYVLKVANSNISLTEKNPNIQKYIKEKLADGIYLLNLPIDCDIKSFLDESGLDFMGKIKSSTTHSQFTSFPILKNGKKTEKLMELANQNCKKLSESSSKQIIKNLSSKVKNRTDLSDLQKENLTYHIEKKLILSEEQLQKVDIRAELLEANGMDFHGKCHLIESAIKENELLQIHVLQNFSNKEIEVLGQPILIEKEDNDAILRMRVIPSNDFCHFEVSKISYVRRIRR